MASGSWEFSTSNSYITGRVRWSSTSNGSSANSSNVTAYLDYKKSSSSTSSTYGTLKGTLVINGSSGSYSGTRTLSCNNTYQNVYSRTVTVAHNSDGKKSITISATGGISGTSFSSSSTSKTVTLDTIPRYATINTFNHTATTQTSATFTWSTNVNCKEVQYCLNNGSWVVYSTATASSGTIVVPNLTPGTTYSIKISVKRSDSNLWTNSSNKSFTTIALASLTNTDISFTIGQDITLNFTNYGNNASYLALDIQKVDGTWETDVLTVDETLAVESYTWNLSASASVLYSKVTTRNTASVRIRCGATINGTKIDKYVAGTMTVANSNPTFSGYTFGNTDSTTNNVLGNTAYMPSNYGNMGITIPVANKAVALNQATIVDYVAEVYNPSGTKISSAVIAYSASAALSHAFGAFSAVGTYSISVYARDSRGNASPSVAKTFYVVSYRTPSLSLTAERQNGYEELTTFVLSSLYSKLTVGSVVKNNSFSIKYRYKRSGESDGSYIDVTDMTYNANYSNTETQVTKTFSITLDSNYSYDFEFLVTDKLFSSSPYLISVSAGIPIMGQYDTGHVVVGKVPDFDSESKLQVGSDVIGRDASGDYWNIIEQIQGFIVVSGTEPTNQIVGGLWIYEEN